MDFHTALGEVIRTKRLANGKTLRQLASKSFLALGYLSEVERGHKQASSAVIEGIANGLGVAPHDLVIETGLLMASEAIPDTAESLFTPIRNTDWQKQYADLR
jgi:transcriptional regulator with XRE-family HTH domain